MLNKLCNFLRKYQMVQPGDHVVCALSGGADSVALVYAMKLLAQKLEITVSAAHFNHHLRGAESDSDESFVRQFCRHHDIELQVGSGTVEPGEKGLEAAARKARYEFLCSLPGKIATAHTADDNAETVLLHLIRGTGLKGLGGIMPVNGKIIRPMLNVTRREVIDFLQEYHLHWINDSSNDTDQFMRNRLRHHVMPLLQEENPKIAENLSATALRLREDEWLLTSLAREQKTDDVVQLRQMQPGLRKRILAELLEQWGVPEPEAAHVALAEKLVLSDKPSAKAAFPGGVTLCRQYDKLVKCQQTESFEPIELGCPGTVELSRLGLRVICEPATEITDKKDCFAVISSGKILLRSRCPGDAMRLFGGTKKLKEIFIDSKIPAMHRQNIPVIADRDGVLGVYGFGANRDRLAAQLPAVEIRFECI